MNKSLYAGLCLAAIGLSASALAPAAIHNNFIAEQSRTPAGGRSLQVLVAQVEIKSNINPSNIAMATGGGLLGALIEAGVDSSRARKAEAAIQPVRVALAGYDADALAVSTSNAALAEVPWFQPKASAFAKDTSVLGKSALLDTSATDQMAFFEYSYDTSPDCSSIRVAVNMQLANKAVPDGKKPDARLAAKFLAYAQSITSVVSLPSPSKEAADNAARWSADNGKLARRALAAGFMTLQGLIPRALGLSEADVASMNGHDKKVALLGGFRGRIQEENPGGGMLYTGVQLVQVQTLSE